MSLTTLAELFASADPQQQAVILPDDGHSTDYCSLSDQVDMLAGCLRASGLKPGDAVAIVLPNGLENVVCFLGATRARLAAAPLNPAYKTEEFQFYLEDIGVKALIGPAEEHAVHAAARALNIPIWAASRNDKGLVELAGDKLYRAPRAPDEPENNDIALFLHTSGTTARPKLVPLTHGNLCASVRNIAAHYQLGPADTGLLVMPLFHVHGLIGATLSLLHAGGTLVTPPRFSASHFWPAVRKHGVKWYSAVPTIHQILLARADEDQAPKQPGFRFIRSCSAALAPATMQQLESRFDAPVLEAYAMTEAAHQMTSNPLPPEPRKPGSVGQGTHVSIAIMDEPGNLLEQGQQGEVVIRGPNVTKGYHNNPDANAQAFTNDWFRTGDRGVLDADGYLTLIGRIKELINRGGEKISPLEVDAALLLHPAVAEAASFAGADPKYGEEVHAAVVLKEHASVADLQQHCGQHIADFKVPKKIHVVKELPKGPTGKVQRRNLAPFFKDA